MAPRDDVNYFKKLEAEKRALDDIWSYSTDHRTIQFWNRTDEWIELTGSFSSQFGPSSINCVTKICLWPRKSYTWRFMGDNFDTQLNVGGGGESSRLTNYAAFMLGIVLPDSYSQSLANNYKWHSKVLNFQLDNFQHPSNESCSDDTSNTIKNEGDSHEETQYQNTGQTKEKCNTPDFLGCSSNLGARTNLNFTLCCTSKNVGECINSITEDTQNAFQEKRKSSFVESAISQPITENLPHSQKSHLPSVESKNAIINNHADDSKILNKNHLVLDNGKNLANNAKEEENDSHIHSLSSTRNMGNWSNLLGIHDLPSIDPLQEANIILSLNVVTSLQILTTSTILSAIQREEDKIQLLPLPKRIKTFLNNIMLNTT